MMEGPKLESAALFLTIFGAMLFMPPLVLLFNIHVRFLGVPLEVIYLFVVWAGLCAATAWFARHLPHAPQSGQKSEAGD